MPNCWAALPRETLLMEWPRASALRDMTEGDLATAAELAALGVLCPEMRDIWKLNFSMEGLWRLPGRLVLGDDKGWEPVMRMLSALGVWVPPRPWDGGTPTILVGTAAGLVSSSARTTASTSSMQMSTFSGLRSVWMMPHRAWR